MKAGGADTWSNASSATASELSLSETHAGKEPGAFDETEQPPEDLERLITFMNAFIEKGEEMVRIVDDELAASSTAPSVGDDAARRVASPLVSDARGSL